MKRNHVPIVFAAAAFLGLAFQSTHAQNLKYEWGTSIGAGDFDLSRAMATDDAGNTYVTGTFNGLVDFNPQDPLRPDTLRSTAKNSDNLGDAFVYKLNTAGQLAWVKRFHNTTGQGWGIKVDKHHNVYVTGDFSQKADFNPSEAPADTFFLSPNTAGPGSSPLNSDVFVVKLDSAGNFLWAKNFGSNKWEQSFGLALDDQDNVFVTGHFVATADFDIAGNSPASQSQLTSLNTNSSYNAFILKLRPNGDFVWVKGILGKGSIRGRGVATDQYGSVYAVGEYFDSISLNPARKYDQLGTGTVTSNGDYDGYIVKLDSSGNYVWGHSFGGTKLDRFTGVAVDKKSNSVYAIYEDQSSDVDFGVPNQTTSLRGFMDAVLLKLDYDGNTVWAKNYGGFYSNTHAGGLAVDSRRGKVYVTGYYSYNTNFNTGNQPADTFYIYRPFGGSDPYVTQIDEQGNFGWAKSFPGGTTIKLGNDIATDPMGSIYTTGYYNGGDIDLNGDTGPGDTAIFHSNGSYDFYTVKMSCQDTSSSYIEKTIDCNKPVFSFHGVDYTETGVYHQILVNASGCDSFVTLDLTFRTMQTPFVTVSGSTLGVLPATYSTYQWLLNGNAIAGATSSTYTVTQNGDYAVVVSNDEGCIDTSDIYKVNSVGSGIEDTRALAKEIHIYPNPATDVVYIQSPVTVHVTLSSVIGRKVREVSDAQEVSLKGLSAGVYLLQVRDRNNILIKVEKIVKK